MPPPPGSLSTEKTASFQAFPPASFLNSLDTGIPWDFIIPVGPLPSPFYCTVPSDPTRSCGFSYLLNKAGAPWQSQRSLHVMPFCLTFNFISPKSTPHVQSDSTFTRHAALCTNQAAPSVRAFACVFLLPGITSNWPCILGIAHRGPLLLMSFAPSLLSPYLMFTCPSA